MLKRLAVAAVLAILAFPTANAQTAAEHVALGDRDHVAMNATGALAHYEAALAAVPTTERTAAKRSARNSGSSR